MTVPTPLPPLRRAGSFAACLLALALGACLDHDAAAPSGIGRARLSLSVSGSAALAAEDRVIEVGVFYLRPSANERVTLLAQQFPLIAGTKELPVIVDLAPCLKDPNRISAAAGCALEIDVVFRDLGGAAVDSQAVGPITASPGETVSVPPLTLREAASITVVSGGAQLGWVGYPIVQPVEVRVVDAAGSPVPDRVIAVKPLTGGGQAEGTARTDANGVARIAYRLGTAPGANTFSVGAIGVAPRTVSVTGISVPRTTLSAGVLSTCSLKPNGALYCWGDNRAGELANPAVVGDTTLPVPAAGGLSFQTVELGVSGNNSTQACALTAAGRAYCWGSNPRDELGIASTGTCPGISDQAHPCATSPQPATGNIVFRTISADANDVGQNGNSASRACGVAADGTAMCWGDGLAGELGNGANASTSAPTPVSGSTKFVYVSTMGRNSCGLATTAEVFCWGLNTSGALGNGTTTSSNVPVKIASSQRFIHVEVGFFFACGLTVDHDVYCWGRIVTPANVFANQPVPTLVPGGLRFESLSVGALHACGLTAARVAYCWGNDQAAGVLGDGVRHSQTPLVGSPVRVAGNLVFAELSAGASQTCGVEIAGTVYCWGFDGRGELGTGARNFTVNVPSRVNFDGVAAGPAATITAVNTTTSPAQSAGSTSVLEPAVRVTDANGYPVAGTPVTFTVTAGNGQLVDLTSTSVRTIATDAAGVAVLTRSVQWVLGSGAGTQSVSARVASATVAPVVFSTTTVIPGPVARLTPAITVFQLVAGGGTSGGGLNFAAVDANGFVVPNVPVTFRLTPGITTSSSLSQTTSRDGVAGIVPVPGTVPRLDTVTVTAAGLAPMIVEVRTNPASLARITFIAQPTSSTPNATIGPPITVELADRFGNRASDRAVTLTLVGGPVAAKLAGTVSVNTVNGIATFSNLAVDLPGTYQLRATSGALTALSAQFSVAAGRIDAGH